MEMKAVLLKVKAIIRMNQKSEEKSWKNKRNYKKRTKRILKTTKISKTKRKL